VKKQAKYAQTKKRNRDVPKNITKVKKISQEEKAVRSAKFYDHLTGKFCKADEGSLQEKTFHSVKPSS